MNACSKCLTLFLFLSIFCLQSRGESWVLKFNSQQSQSFIDCGNATDYISSGAFTLEAWIYVDNFAGNYIMASESWSNDNGALGFAFRMGSKGQLEMNFGTGNWETITSGENAVKLNKWQHVAVAVGQDKTVNLYVDGAEVVKGTLVNAMRSSVTHLFIGEGSMWQGRGLDGKLSDVRIWRVKKSAADIQAHMSSALTGHEDELVSNWLLNEGSGTNLVDLTGIHPVQRGAGTSWVSKSSLQAKGSIKILTSGKDSIFVSLSNEVVNRWRLGTNSNLGEVSFRPTDDHSAYMIYQAQVASHRVDTIHVVAETLNGATFTLKVAAELYDNKYQYYGEELLDQIHNDFFNKSNGLYAEQIAASGQFIQATSFLWPASHMLRALKNAWILNPEKYESLFYNYLDAMEQYRVTNHGSTGYAVLPNNFGERFYDDNGLLVIQFSNIYDRSKDDTVLERLKVAYTFNNDVHDNHWGLPQNEIQLGYGMFYSMAVNQTSYGAAKLYQITKESQYLDDALMYYNNQNNTSFKIKDATTNLFNQASYFKNGVWSLSGTVNGTVQHGGGYRAYQTSVVVQNALLLYQITGETKYLDDALKMANACVNHWYRKGAGLTENSFWGGNDLIDMFLDLYNETSDVKWLDISKDIMDFLSVHNRDLRGYYASDYDDSKGDWNLRRTNLNPSQVLLMGQAAAASSFLNVAISDKGISSDIKELNQNARGNEMVLYPNPANGTDEIKIVMPEVLAAKCTIRIYNQSGQLVRIMDQDSESGSHQLAIRPGLKTPGIYMLQVISGSKSYQARYILK